MARLSNSTRESMAIALVKHRFAAEGAELIAESAELFRKLYDDQYEAEDDRTLPVVQVAHLNSKFDLPPSERPAA